MANLGSRARERDFARIIQEKYHGHFDIRALADLKKRAAGEPLDYVIGWVPFLGVRIDLSMRPFIPRPETEYWVGEAIRALRGRKEKNIRILDMFTGSGCIGIAVLKHIPGSQVVCTDAVSRFLRQAKINLERNHISKNRFYLQRSDLFEKINKKFDVIFANPPYVGARAHLDEEVKKYEPKTAYYGGKGGLAAIRPFLKDARRFVKPGGQIWMEFGSSQKSHIAGLLGKFGYRKFSFHRDQYGRPRYVVIRV